VVGLIIGPVEGPAVSETSDKKLPWRQQLYELIFEADTPAGKAFDVVLLVAILLSVLSVVLESVSWIREDYGSAIRVAEWVFTILFTVEYVLRLIAVRRPLIYMRSFFGIVDLLAIAPTYLSLFIPGAHSLLVIRALRLLRVFRVFKVARYVSEITALVDAIRATRTKIAVFLAAVLTVVLILGTAMYVIEGEASGFKDIPTGMYWAIVTVTTVGYGDIAPQTTVGQALAALAMVLGYSFIIIPTGIFSMELARRVGRELTTQVCPECLGEGHEPDAAHCKHCGSHL